MNKANNKATNSRGFSFEEPKTIPTASPLGMRYTLSFDSDVTEQHHYNYFSQVLLAANENDVVDIFFNTNGGSVQSMIQLLNLIITCRATTVGHLVGTAASAGSFLFLACQEHNVGAWTDMLCHTVKFGSYGKLHDVEDHVKHVGEQAREIARDIYKHFLTPEEIEKVLGGYEMFIKADEIRERLATMRKLEAEELAQSESELSEKLLTEMEEAFKAELPNEDELKGVSRKDLVAVLTGKKDLDDVLESEKED